MEAEGNNEMSLQHAVGLIRSNREARGGIFLSVLLVGLIMGWLALAYARLNLYLILLSFPMFNAIVTVFLISIILIRAESNNLTDQSTISGGIRKTIMGDVTVSMIVGIGLNAFFEVIAIVMREYLIEIWGQTLPPIDYSVDLITLFLFITCNISFYICFAGFAIWLFSQARVTVVSGGEKLAKLEGFVSVKFFIVAILLVGATMLLGLIIQTAITSAQGNMAIEPVLVAFASIVFNIALSVLLWTSAWKSID